jgi:hypothetical protein
VDNVGMAPWARTTIEFVLTNDIDNPTQGYFLGSSVVPALAPGAVQDIAQTIKFPGRLPNGTNIPASSYGRIMAIVDPENIISESTKSNDDIQSGPISLQLLWGGTDSVVPMSPPIRTSQPTTTTTTTTAATTPVITAKDALAQARKARKQATVKNKSTGTAAVIAAQLRAERAAAARARAIKAAQAAAKRKKGNSVVRALINYENTSSSSIVSLLNKLK